MEEYLNDDICEFDNDASASSFGWDFQVNAGIFLFLKYAKESTDIKIESKKQDIEITLKNGSKIFAQAKSAQDYSVDTHKKSKFKDALISLARNPYKNNRLIYISNIPDTLNKGKDAFNKVVVSYSDCPKGVRNEIDILFAEIIDSISKKEMKEKKPENKSKLDNNKRKISNFHKENLYISTIHPYYGSTESRYQVIEDAVIQFLANSVNLPREDTVMIEKKLLEYWQLSFWHDSTIKDEHHGKKISKGDFMWPIIIFLTNDSVPDIEESLTFSPDRALKNAADRLMNSSNRFYHARYEFTNKVLTSYEKFKKLHRNERISLEIEFLKNNYNEFMDEFNEIADNDYELKEYITKAIMYKIVANNRCIVKVCNAVGVKI